MPSNGHKGKRKPHRNISTNEDLIEQVVLATFLHGGQPSDRAAGEVASELGLSKSAVLALRRAGHERKLYTVHVELRQERKDIHRLQEAVRVRYGLQGVQLVTGRPEILQEMDQMRRRALHTDVICAMAGVVVQQLDAVISAAARRGDSSLVLGVAWGRSMNLVVQRLLTTARPVRCPVLKVVPIVGITAVRNAEPVEANVVAMAIAQAYGGASEQLPSPAFVPALDYRVATQREPIRSMLRNLPNCRVVLTSMGPIPDSCDDGSEITLSNDPELNRRLLDSARRDGAIGEICYSLFDRNGDEVQSDYKAIGLGYQGLKSIAADAKRQVILVAGGDRRRFEPLRAALRARLASVLVSDTVTARYLVDEVQP